MTRSQIGQLCEKLPCNVTALRTNGSSEKLTGCGPQPTLLIWPAGRIISIASFSVAETPAASITTSEPYPSRNDRVHVTTSSPLAPRVADAAICSATCNRRLSAAVPMTTISPAPASFAIAVQSRPIGPGPMTATASPGRIRALFMAWNTASSLLSPRFSID